MVAQPPAKNYFNLLLEAPPQVAVAKESASPLPEKDYREALLSKAQRDWLEQMSNIYR